MGMYRTSAALVAAGLAVVLAVLVGGVRAGHDVGAVSGVALSLVGLAYLVTLEPGRRAATGLVALRLLAVLAAVLGVAFTVDAATLDEIMLSVLSLLGAYVAVVGAASALRPYAIRPILQGPPAGHPG